MGSKRGRNQRQKQIEGGASPAAGARNEAVSGAESGKKPPSETAAGVLTSPCVSRQQRPAGRAQVRTLGTLDHPSPAISTSPRDRARVLWREGRERSTGNGCLPHSIFNPPACESPRSSFSPARLSFRGRTKSGAPALCRRRPAPRRDWNHCLPAVASLLATPSPAREGSRPKLGCR